MIQNINEYLNKHPNLLLYLKIMIFLLTTDIFGSMFIYIIYNTIDFRQLLLSMFFLEGGFCLLISGLWGISDWGAASLIQKRHQNEPNIEKASIEAETLNNDEKKRERAEKFEEISKKRLSQSCFGLLVSIALLLTGSLLDFLIP